VVHRARGIEAVDVRAGLVAGGAPTELWEVALDDGPDRLLIKEAAQLEARDKRGELFRKIW
jgi:hypothetical protein